MTFSIDTWLNEFAKNKTEIVDQVIFIGL